MLENLPPPSWQDATYWIFLLGLVTWSGLSIFSFRRSRHPITGNYPVLSEPIPLHLFLPPALILPSDFQLLGREEQIRSLGKVLYHWQLEIGTFPILNDGMGSYRVREIVEVMEVQHEDEGFRDAIGMWRLRIKTTDALDVETIYRFRDENAWVRVPP